MAKTSKISWILKAIDIGHQTVPIQIYNRSVSDPTTKTYSSQLGSVHGGIITLVYFLTMILLCAFRFHDLLQGSFDVVSNYKKLPSVKSEFGIDLYNASITDLNTLPILRFSTHFLFQEKHEKEEQLLKYNIMRNSQNGTLELNTDIKGFD